MSGGLNADRLHPLITDHSQDPPLTDKIYPTKAECEAIRFRLNERRPLAHLECGEVRR